MFKISLIERTRSAYSKHSSLSTKSRQKLAERKKTRMKISTLLYWSSWSYWFRPNLPSSKFNIAFVSLPKMEWKKCITMRSTKYSNSKLWTGNKLLFRFHASHGCIGGVSEQRSHDRTQVLWLNQMKQSKSAGTVPSFKSLLFMSF